MHEGATVLVYELINWLLKINFLQGQVDSEGMCLAEEPKGQHDPGDGFRHMIIGAFLASVIFLFHRFVLSPPAPAPAPGPQNMVDAFEVEMRQVEYDRLRQKEGELRRQEVNLQLREYQCSQSEGEIAEKRRILAIREEQAEEREQWLSEREARVEEKEAAVEEREKVLEHEKNRRRWVEALQSEQERTGEKEKEKEEGSRVVKEERRRTENDRKKPESRKGM